MLGALTSRTRVTTDVLLREARFDAATGHERHSTGEPSASWSSGSCDITVLLFTTKIKQCVPFSPPHNCSFKLEIAFCVRGVISPLLSNLYMRRFVLGWKKLGHEKRFGAHIVNYADDMVICCRGHAEEALVSMRDMMSKLKLTVNETKTRVCKLPEEKFDLLGYTFGRCYSTKTGRAYIGTVPSKKRVQRICAAISDETGRNKTTLDVEDIVGKLNQMLRGWANYFCLGPVSKAYSAVDQHTRKRLRQWLCAKHQVAWPGKKRFPSASFYKVYGLVSLTERTASLPWATS